MKKANKSDTVGVPSIPAAWRRVSDAEGEIWIRRGDSRIWVTGIGTELREKIREPELIYKYGPVTRADQDNPEASAPPSAAPPQQVLEKLLETLDSWIEGQKGNHEALGHRQHPRFEECWNMWGSDDIRSMVNDTARDLGLTEPWEGRG